MPLDRPPLIVDSLTVRLPGLRAFGSLQCFRRLAGGVAESSCTFLVEQRTLQHCLNLGELVKRRNTERGKHLFEELITEFGLDLGHISEPQVHTQDSCNVILFSFPLSIAWMGKKVAAYTSARGSREH